VRNAGTRWHHRIQPGAASPYSVAVGRRDVHTDGMTPIEFSLVDAATASDDELAEVHALHITLEEEALPGEPTPPLELSLANYRHRPSYEHYRWEVARRDGALVGVGFASWDDLPENRSHAFVDASVAPFARRAGVGSTLLRHAIDAAAGWDATLLDLGARVGGPADPFLRNLGAELRQVDRISVCRSADLDRALLAGWVRQAGERASAFSLVAWDGPCPEEHIESFCALNLVMNTAPRDGVETDDFSLTPEQLRDYEAIGRQRGYERWTLCARHDGSGEFAGFTELVLPGLWPEMAYQQNTGVWPKHRDRGLGRWLKATMALRLLAERPDVTRIQTGNADSNEAMLAINVAMGFRPKENWGVWQVALDRARHALQHDG
jgi:mycothiol synthase